MKIITSMIALVALSGCSLAPFYAQVRATTDEAISRAVDDRMEYNDDKARLVLRLPCDLSVGAYYRLANEREQQAIGLLCSPATTGLPEE